MARMLLDAGAEFDECDDYGGNPGTYAATYGHEGILKMLLDRELHVEERYRPSYEEMDDECRLLHLAVRGRHVETVRLLLGAGADPNSRIALSLGSGFQKETPDGRTPMHFAAWRDGERIKVLIGQNGLGRQRKRKTQLLSQGC
jgi:ankyrin repeat protein